MLDRPADLALLGELRNLPEVQRTALVLRHIGGLSAAQAAEEEGVPFGVVESRLVHGRLALAGRLAPSGDGECGTDTWVIRRLARIGDALERSRDAPPVGVVFRRAVRRRVAITVVALAVVSAGGVGIVVAVVHPPQWASERHVQPP